MRRTSRRLGPVDVVGADAVVVFGHYQPVFVLQGVAGVVIAAAPVLFHGEAAEFVIFRVAFPGFLAVDELHDVDGG
jgi:hypothetical protein